MGADSSIDKVSCSPDPHCSFEGERCKCCYNGGCDYEDACRCSARNEAAVSSAVASLLDKGSCAPDPHCNLEGDRCKCCFNGGCDYEDLCRCSSANNNAIVNSTASLDVASQGGWCQRSGEACGWGSWPFGAALARGARRRWEMKTSGRVSSTTQRPLASKWVRCVEGSWGRLRSAVAALIASRM